MKDLRRALDDTDTAGPTDEDLTEADALLKKADALLRRHRFGPDDAASPSIDDDLPILTEIIDTPRPSAPAPAPASRAGSAQTDKVDTPTHHTPVDIVDQLIELDADLNREIEAWFARELPALLSRELDTFSRHLREQAVAHLRASLLPTLSARIASRLDTAADLSTAQSTPKRRP